MRDSEYEELSSLETKIEINHVTVGTDGLLILVMNSPEVSLSFCIEDVLMTWRTEITSVPSRAWHLSHIVKCLHGSGKVGDSSYALGSGLSGVRC